MPAETIQRPWDFTYDASGNQTQSVYRNSDTRDIVWNEDDQIKEVIDNGQLMNQTLYDAQGTKAVHLHHVSGLEETAYLGGNLTLRDGRYLTKHIYTGEKRAASKMDPDWFQNPPTIYFHTDHLGSTNYSTNDNQALVQHDEYFPTGELWRDETNSQYELARRYTFTGKELDIATGLIDFGARSYDPKKGQWLSPDPILDQYMEGELNQGVFRPGNLGSYTYSFNNPVAFTDADGQYARITRKGNSVRIVIPILFRNNSTLDQKQYRAKLQSWTKSIEKTWSGKFGNLKVDTTVSLLSEAEAREIGVQGRGLNVINVEDPAATSSSPAEVAGWTTNLGDDRRTIKGASEESVGRFNADASDDTVAHESGHLLGLHHSDAPSEYGEHTNWERQYDKTNIMTPIEGGRKPDARPNEYQAKKIADYCNYGCEK